MKTTKSALVFIITFVLGYFFLSLFGCMFFDSEGNHFKFDYIVGQPAWTMIYSILIGSWLPGMIAQDYYHNLEYKERKNKNAYN